jgi:uncharacterized protein
VNVVRYGTPQAFLDAVEPFLLPDEACHNLLLGIAARLIARGLTVADVYLAAALDRGEIAGAAMMTSPYRLVLSQMARPGAVRALAEDVATLRPPPPGLNGPDPVAAEFVAVWQELTGERSRRALHERIHRLDALRPVPRVPGRMRPAADADRPLLLDWLRAFGAEAFGKDNRPPGEAERVLNTRLGGTDEGLVLWDDGGPRCLAGYAGPTRHGVRIGPVYTPPQHRRRGYATACVAELSGLLLERGRRFCMLFTDLANATSNRIYQRIGYEPICDVAEYRFIRDGGDVRPS